MYQSTTSYVVVRLRDKCNRKRQKLFLHPMKGATITTYGNCFTQAQSRKQWQNKHNENNAIQYLSFLR